MHQSPPAPHVLLIDDAPDLLALLGELLDEEGYRVTTSDALLDLAEIRQLAPDIIVHDVRFTRSDATAVLSLVQAVRADPLVGHAPLILCTADGRIDQRPEWQAVIACLDLPVLRKPFDLTTFLDMVAMALRDWLAMRRSACDSAT